MTHAWKQSIDIDKNKAQQLIESQFHLTVHTIRLLKELHSIPPTKEYASLIKGDQTWRLNLNRVSRCEENLSRYESYFLKAGFNTPLLLDIIALLPQLNIIDTRQSYLHGDLYSRHIIVNPSTRLPHGLIDWGDTHIGNPGIDLAVGMILQKKYITYF